MTQVSRSVFSVNETLHGGPGCISVFTNGCELISPYLMSRLPHMLFNLPQVDEDEGLLFVLPLQGGPGGEGRSRGEADFQLMPVHCKRQRPECAKAT